MYSESAKQAKAPKLPTLIINIIIILPRHKKKIKLLRILFLRCHYYSLTGTRIMSSYVVVLTASRVCFFRRLPTTVRLRFLLHLIRKVLIVL